MIGSNIRRSLEALMDAPELPVSTNTVPEILFGNEGETFNTHLGWWYEHLHAVLFGGKRLKDLYPEVDAKRLPDIVDETTRTITEVKGNSIRHSAQLRDSQLALYEALQQARPDFMVRFAIYHHSFEKIKSYRGEEAEIYNYLAQHTIGASIVPLSLMRTMHAARTSPYFRRYTSRELLEEETNGEHIYESCTCFQVSGLRLLLQNPQQFMQFIGADPSSYVLSRYVLPRTFYKRRVMRPFPILLIEDKKANGHATTNNQLPIYVEQESITRDVEALLNHLPAPTSHDEIPF